MNDTLADALNELRHDRARLAARLAKTDIVIGLLEQLISEPDPLQPAATPPSAPSASPALISAEQRPGPGRYPCRHDTCDQTFTTKQRRLDHEADTHDMRPWPELGDAAPPKPALAADAPEQGPLQPPPVWEGPLITPADPWTCDRDGCDRTGGTLIEQQIHRDEHRRADRRAAQALAAESEQLKPAPAFPAPGPAKPHPCPQCPAGFDTAKSLGAHSARHRAAEHLHVCPCGFQAATGTGLAAHQRRCTTIHPPPTAKPPGPAARPAIGEAYSDFVARRNAS